MHAALPYTMLSPVARTAFWALLCGAALVCAHPHLPGEYVLYQPAEPGETHIYQSDTLYFDACCAGLFWFSERPGTLAHVQWWGLYAMPEEPLAWRLAIYTNGTGLLPDLTIHEWFVTNTCVHRNVIYPGPFDAISFWTRLDPPFTPRANIAYWLSVQAISEGYDPLNPFFWYGSPYGLGFLAWRSAGVPWELYRHDAAFAFTTGELYGEALHVHRMAVRRRGGGNDGYQLRTAFNWGGTMPPYRITLQLGTKTNYFISLRPRGTRYVDDTREGYVLTLDPRRHTIDVHARGVDLSALGATPLLGLWIEHNPNTFKEHRPLALAGDLYRETRDLTVRQFFLDRARIKDTARAGRDRIDLSGFLHCTATGAASGVYLDVVAGTNYIYQVTVPIAQLTVDADGVRYQRPRGATTPLRLFRYDHAQRSFMLMVDLLDLPGPLPAGAEVPLAVTLDVHVGTYDQAAAISVRARQPRPGLLQY
jgi:hypothetical protein